jgi:hypothetical protein
MTKKLITMAMVVLLAGCTTFNKTAVTLTEAEDAIMKEWATLHNDHKTTSELDLKVMKAHAAFKESCLVAATFLHSYSEGGADKASYVAALEAARASIGPLLQLIEPLLSSTKIAKLHTTTTIASKP